jgi:hypothetical protein
VIWIAEEWPFSGPGNRRRRDERRRNERWEILLSAGLAMRKLLT